MEIKPHTLKQEMQQILVRLIRKLQNIWETNKNTTYENLSDVVKTMIRVIIMSINTITKENILQINNLT